MTTRDNTVLELFGFTRYQYDARPSAGAEVSSSAGRANASAWSRNARVVIDGDHPHWHCCQDLTYDVGVPQGVDRDFCWVYAVSGRHSPKQSRMISPFPRVSARLGQ
jgi:hypothetical protein